MINNVFPKKLITSFLLFLLSFLPFLFSIYASGQSTEQVDPFYEKLFEEGKYFYNLGKYPDAIKNWEIASFGLIDYPNRLSECYVYLTVCHYRAGNQERARYYWNEIDRLSLSKNLKSAQLSESLLNNFAEISAYFGRQEPRPASSPPAALIKPAPSSTPRPGIPGSSFDMQIKQLKDSIKNNKSDSEAYLKLSAIYIEQKRPKEAKSILEDLLKLSPKMGRAHFELGKILCLEKKTKEALPHFQAAASSLSEDIELRYETGKAYFDLKDYAEAKKEFLKVQSLSSQYRDAENYLSKLQEIENVKLAAARDFLARARQEKNISKKIQYYRRALENDASSLDVYFELADVYRVAKKYDKATRVLEVLLKYDPQNARIYAELGATHLADKSFASAITRLRQGKKVDPDDPQFPYLLGKAYMGNKKYKEAAIEFNEVLSLSPDYKDTRQLLEICLKKK